jgi:hypothetical protein
MHYKEVGEKWGTPQEEIKVLSDLWRKVEVRESVLNLLEELKEGEDRALHSSEKMVEVYRAQGALSIVERFVNRLDDICKEVRDE